MGFNPAFPSQYNPTSTKDAFQLIDNIGNYSESSDTITTIGFPVLLQGKYILLHDGNDNYTGTAFNSPGWDNIANGNRGEDKLVGNIFRDFLRGGKDKDTVTGGTKGADFLLGDAEDDIVTATSTDKCILRGGRGNDRLNGNANSDLLVGDFGIDTMRGNGGKDYFVLRSDKNDLDGLNNLSSDINEVDFVTDFKTGDDYIVMPGITNKNRIKIEDDGFFKYKIGVIQDDLSVLYAGYVQANGILTDARIVVGDDANTIYNCADGNDPSTFLNNINCFDIK